MTDAELQQAMRVAKRVARKFASRVHCWHRVDDYEGAAFEAVAKALRSWDASSDVPFTAWVDLKANGAVIDEHRRWYGRRLNMHDDALSLNLISDGAYIDPPSPDNPERVVVDRDTACRALATLDAVDAERGASGKGGVRRSPSTRSVVVGSAVGRSQLAMAGGDCTDTMICKILHAGRNVVSEVMAS